MALQGTLLKADKGHLLQQNGGRIILQIAAIQLLAVIEMPFRVDRTTNQQTISYD